MAGIKKSLLLFWPLLLLALPAFAVSSPEHLVQKAYYNWCASIGTAKGDAKEMVQYYAPNAILLPTLSSEVLFNSDGGMDAYFSQLTSYKNIQCTPKKLVTRLYGDFVAVDAGLYDFSFFDHDGKAQTLHARFTFVYEKFGDKWLIVSHHSSVKPD
jgi:uncharacterized protein (TIGR02246 family)